MCNLRITKQQCRSDIKPLLFLRAVAGIVCSYAFALPVATAPNAIVFGHSTLKTSDMMKVIHSYCYDDFKASNTKDKLSIGAKKLTQKER